MNRATGSPTVSDGWLGMDIGGANLKFANGRGDARTVAFELWKRPADLGREIADATSALPPFQNVALTMTAELCDCFRTKAEGVEAVLSAVRNALPGTRIMVWGLDGRFHGIDEISRQPNLAAAANWLALATLAARFVPDEKGILIDIGSTTADLIPLDRGKVAARGRTDTERLTTGELVYAGVRRTPICALAADLPYRGAPKRLAAELFATTLDVYLTLGEIAPDHSDFSTADGRPATLEFARERLARMVCADRETFSTDDAMALARAADDRLCRRLVEAAEMACAPTIGRPRFAVVSGSGEFLALRLSRQILPTAARIERLSEAWGAQAAGAGCAHAVAVLAAELPPPADA